MGLIDYLSKDADVSWLLPLPREAPPPHNAEVLCSEGFTDDRHEPTEYRVLRYVPGRITCCAANGLDVISYPFSGCIMASFTEGRVRKVCHVSTGDGPLNCKRKWFEIQQGLKEVRCYKPSDALECYQRFNQPGYTPPPGLDGKCFGLITAGDNPVCYAVAVGWDGTRGKVAEITPCRRCEEYTTGCQRCSGVTISPQEKHGPTLRAQPQPRSGDPLAYANKSATDKRALSFPGDVRRQPS